MDNIEKVYVAVVPVKNGTWTDGFTTHDKWCCPKCSGHLEMKFGRREDIHWCPYCGAQITWIGT